MMTRTAKKMLGSVFLRALGRGKVTMVAVVVALTLATISPALAANGGNFILGVSTNTATAITQLTANIANPALKLVNTSTAAGATALNLQTASTKPPMTVNSSTKVANLNADTVDGKDSATLLPGGDLPSGRTVRGAYGMLGQAASPAELVPSESISFGYRLASSPTVQFVRSGQPSTTQCPGTASSPEAAKGYLCVYEGPRHNMYDSSYPRWWTYNRTGAVFYTYTSTAGLYQTYGTWAVTAA